MADRRIVSGMIIGLVLAAAATGYRFGQGNTGRPPARGPILSDCDGALREIAIQYVRSAGSIVDKAYREFLRRLPSDVTVYAICPDRASFETLRDVVGPVACMLKPVAVGHEMTCWSRDRWVTLAPAEEGGRPVMALPLVEMGEGIWAARSGDAANGESLSRATSGRFVAWRSSLVYDGGDFVADDREVFVSPQVRERSVGSSAETEPDLLRLLDLAFGKRAVLMCGAPMHHAGMFMMTAGDRTAVVADPSLAVRAFSEEEGFPEAAFRCPSGADFSEETQKRFDSVALLLTARGYEVTRIPVVPGRDGRTYLSYVNVIIDERNGERTVYMPVYEGWERLNRAAAGTWEGLGYRVEEVDCTAVYPNFGSLRCLVNVLSRNGAYSTSRLGETPRPPVQQGPRR